MSDSDEQLVDVQEFVLQKAPGDGAGDIQNFENCYVGEYYQFKFSAAMFDQFAIHLLLSLLINLNKLKCVHVIPRNGINIDKEIKVFLFIYNMHFLSFLLF